MVGSATQMPRCATQMPRSAVNDERSGGGRARMRDMPQRHVARTCRKDMPQGHAAKITCGPASVCVWPAVTDGLVAAGALL